MMDSKIHNDNINSLLEEAKVNEKKIPLKDSPAFQNLNINNYLDNVELFWKEQPFSYDKNCIFWFWNKDKYRWEIVDEIDLMNAMEAQLSFKGMTLSFHIKGSYLEAFKRVGRNYKPKEVHTNWVQFQNKVINIRSAEEFDAIPEYFFKNPIPRKIDLFNEQSPTIDSLLIEWVGMDYISTLKEIIAYCLLADYPLQRLFCLVGSGSNGKTCFLKMLTKFIGPENVVATELDNILSSNNRFGSSVMFGKLVTIMGETNFNEIKKASMLKQLVGGDLINYEFKNKNPFTGKNYSKIIIATNSLPVTADKTDGFYRRWLLIDFPNKFTEKRDILGEIPEQEYDALALQCIGILRDLLQRREFTKEGSIEDRKQKYEDVSNPLDRFLREECDISDPDGFIFKYELRETFLTWLKANNYRQWSDRELGSKMKEKFEMGKKPKDFWEEGTMQVKYLNAWLGLKFKGENEG